MHYGFITPELTNLVQLSGMIKEILENIKVTVFTYHILEYADSFIKKSTRFIIRVDFFNIIQLQKFTNQKLLSYITNYF